MTEEPLLTDCNTQCHSCGVRYWCEASGYNIKWIRR